MNQPPFADRVVVVTGASSGIGAEVARQMAAQGAWLSLGARREHELDVVAQACIAQGGRAVLTAMDVSVPEQCARLVQHTLDSFGRIDLLVNNAGIGAHFRFDETKDLRVYERLMQVNYLGCVYMTHAALPALKLTRGQIAVMSSLAGKTGVPERTAYSATKHALHGFFDSLRIELESSGVGVTMICPGFVTTDIRAHALGADGEALGASPLREEGVMPVEECARRSLEAVAHRDRELVMTPAWPLKAIAKALVPQITDQLAARAVEERKRAHA